MRQKDWANVNLTQYLATIEAELNQITIPTVYARHRYSVVRSQFVIVVTTLTLESNHQTQVPSNHSYMYIGE